MTWWASAEWLEYERICGIAQPRTEELFGAVWDTRMIDLRKPVAELWSDVRRSYHALIHKAQRDYTIMVPAPAGLVDSERCRMIHLAAAGRATRPTASWDRMGGWLQRGQAFVVLALEKEGDGCFGFAYIIVDGGWSYYGSGASVRKDLSHALIWEAILEAQRRGLDRFEIGWQGHAQSEKEKNIEWFKSGFGGALYPANIEAILESKRREA